MKRPWIPLAVSFVTLLIIGVLATKQCMHKGREAREATEQPAKEAR